MTQQHPTTPPPELLEQWIGEIWHEGTPVRVAQSDLHLATRAAQWGLSQCSRLPVPAHFLGVPLIPPADCMDSQSWIAMRIYQMGCDQRGKDIERERQEAADQELEACCEWILNETSDECFVANLRAARRPDPQTLNSLALEMLGTVERMEVVIPEITDTIRRALEQLPNQTSDSD